MTRIENGMGEEIIRCMETILCQPGKVLLCARYCSGAGAIQAFYMDNCGAETISWYWFKLLEEVKDPQKETAHIVAIHESKLPLAEFLKFLVDEKTLVFKMSTQFEQAIKKVMTPDLVLDFVKAGVNLERTGLGLPAIDFSDGFR
jgi:hypothetical protein